MAYGKLFGSCTRTVRRISQMGAAYKKPVSSRAATVWRILGKIRVAHKEANEQSHSYRLADFGKIRLTKTTNRASHGPVGKLPFGGFRNKVGWF